MRASRPARARKHRSAVPFMKQHGVGPTGYYLGERGADVLEAGSTPELGA